MTSVKPNPTSTFFNNFALKHQPVQLIPESHSPSNVLLALRDLEALRVNGGVIPASKNGLEIICGASCETAAN
jgi:hypothetical protein